MTARIYNFQEEKRKREVEKALNDSISMTGDLGTSLPLTARVYNEKDLEDLFNDK